MTKSYIWQRLSVFRVEEGGEGGGVTIELPLQEKGGQRTDTVTVKRSQSF